MSQTSQATILIVDNDVESLITMASILTDQRQRVVTAQDATSAIETAHNETLDLLITDTRLGPLSGMELLTTLRLEPAMRDLPVMFVSAHQSPGIIRRSYDSGDAYHVKKPLDPQVLSELVEKALWLPHLVKNHIEQKSVKQPHVAFSQTTIADPLGACLGFPGTPVTF